MGDLLEWMEETFIAGIWFQYGEPVFVKLIKDKYSNGNAGYCFVDFTHHEAAAICLNTLNGSIIPGTSRLFKLNWATGNVLNLTGEIRPKEYTVYIGDLAPEVNDFLLLSAFQPRFRTIKHVKVVIDHFTGTSRCYGFVRFADENEQQRAIMEMNGVYIGSKPILVSTAVPRARMLGDHSQSSGAIPLTIAPLPKAVLAMPKPKPPQPLLLNQPPAFASNDYERGGKFGVDIDNCLRFGPTFQYFIVKNEPNQDLLKKKISINDLNVRYYSLEEEFYEG
ncbi:hypothetical protein HK099_008266, partial [Clydaea vesicula]